MKFQLCLYAEYTDESGAAFTSVFYNATIPIIESSRETSAKIMFVLFLLSLIAAGVGIKLYLVWSAREQKKKKKAKKAEAEAAASVKSEDEIKAEWLAGVVPGSKKEKKGGGSGGSKPRTKKA